MSNTTLLARLSCVLPLLLLAACASASGDDATGESPPAPLDPVGRYVVETEYSLQSPPAGAATILAEIAAATDGPDDPSRFLIDRVVARLPEGRTQLVAAAVAPYLAAYVQERIDRVAPKLAEGLRGLGAGLERVARKWGTTEQLAIGEDGRAHRLVTGLTLDGVDVSLASAGEGETATACDVAMSGDRLTFATHALTLPYSVVLRAGLDRAVVPHVVPGATSLDVAFASLVDCDSLGVVASEYVGVGSPELYAGACRLALARFASEVYERLDVGPAAITVAGSARVIDLQGDGPADVITKGVWTGTVGNAPIASATFEGRAP